MNLYISLVTCQPEYIYVLGWAENQTARGAFPSVPIMRQTIQDQFVFKHPQDGRFIPALFDDIGDSFYLGVPHSHPLALNLVGKIDGKIPTIIPK